MELIADLKFTIRSQRCTAVLTFLGQAHRQFERLESFFRLNRLLCLELLHFLLLLFKRRSTPRVSSSWIWWRLLSVFLRYSSLLLHSLSSRPRFVHTPRQGRDFKMILYAPLVLALCPLGFCSFLYSTVFGTGRFYLCPALCGLVLYRVDRLNVY